MSDSRYRPDLPINMTDAMIRAGSGPEPHFDTVMQTFLFECLVALRNACQRGGLLRYASLGVRNPWLYRLEFRTRGLARDEEGEIATVERHVLALRFLPDYLRVADRFAMLRLIEPSGRAFHPNISSAGAICVEIYPGESVIEICQSLHDLFRWRLRQYDERDALNPAACAWGRQNIDQPIDDRPLFGQRTSFQWRPTDNLHGEQA